MSSIKSVMTLGVLVSSIFCYSTVMAAGTAPALAPKKAPKLVPVTKLVKTDTTIGTGAEAAPGKTVTINYTGWLYSYVKADHQGREFDSSIGRRPLTFPLGVNRIIKGWDQGIAGMKVGGKRTLIVPSDLAYGERGMGRGAVPRNAALIFDIELLGVQ